MPDSRSTFFKSTLILLCAFFVFSNSCQNHDAENGRSGHFPLELLRADFTQMRSALESNHPDRLRYETEQTLRGLFDAAYASLRDGMTEGEFYRVVAPLVARTHCGHTNIRPSDGFSGALGDSARVLPLGIYLDGGLAYVDADYGADSGIPLGSEILAINNEAVAGVVERLLAGISADALNVSAKIHRLSRSFYLYYYYFWGEVPRFDLRVKDASSGAESLVQVNARPYSQVSRDAGGRFPWSGRLALEINGSLAVLTVPSFVIGQNPDYRAFFADAFQRLNNGGVKRLIIDIRGNGGGDPDLSACLIAHLIDKPFIYFKKGQGYDYLFTETAPHAVHFNGTPLVLIDGGCFSTSGHFCSLVRHHALASFVGETGGGTFRCHDNSREFVLSHTGMRLRVARTTYEAAVPDQDVSAGFPPDFRVYPGIQDILSGSDPQMDFAVRKSEEEK